MIKEDIVISGLGVISPVGIGKTQYWQSLKDVQSSFKKISLFDTEELEVNTGGEVMSFDPKTILPNLNTRDFDRATILLNSAAKLALDDGNYKIDETNSPQTGVSVGTTFGSLYSISEFDKESVKDGPKFANPTVFTSTVGNSPASRIAIIFKIKGLNATISTGMSAGLDALDYAISQIRLGRADTMICGALEVISPQIFLGFLKLNYLAGLKKKPLICCPFDKRRNGIILSEGSSVFIIETKKQAKERKAQIYAKISGVGSWFDSNKLYNYNPTGNGMKEAMKRALDDAKLEPKDIDVIFANANSTNDADLIETKAIKSVFGEHAAKIPVTAIKSIIGETYSGSGGMSLAAAVGTLSNDFIPGVLNLEYPDADCDLNYVKGSSINKKVSRIMVNAFGPNGDNTSLIIERAG